MTRFMILVFGVMGLSLFSSLVFAHGGHDHNHWSSTPLHLLSVVAIITVVMSVLFAMAKRVKVKKSPSSE